MKIHPTCHKSGSVLKNKGKPASADLPPDGMPFTEIPNEQIASVGREFRETVDYLFARIGEVHCASPLMTMAAFGIEVFLKSLNAKCVYIEDDDFDDAYTITAKPLKRGHELVTKFEELDEAIRKGLEEAYRLRPVVKDKSSIRDALSVYNSLFVDARYPFEAVGSGGRDITGLVHLLRLVGDYVDSLPKTVTFKSSPVVSAPLRDVPPAQTPPASEPR